MKLLCIYRKRLTNRFPLCRGRAGAPGSTTEMTFHALRRLSMSVQSAEDPALVSILLYVRLTHRAAVSHGTPINQERFVAFVQMLTITAQAVRATIYLFLAAIASAQV